VFPIRCIGGVVKDVVKFLTSPSTASAFRLGATWE